MYLRGVGVGLIIAWVTSVLAYFIVGAKKSEQMKKLREIK